VRLVIDASVAVKWFFHNKLGEQDTKQALDILDALRNGQASAIQPPHWKVEAMSVLVREAPVFAEEALEVLDALALAVSAEERVYSLGVKLSHNLKHHLFDTLYHAVALEYSANLITADDVYFGKAYRLGNIQLLMNFRAPQVG
jgi:predicted nucleic acid-binding protein